MPAAHVQLYIGHTFLFQFQWIELKYIAILKEMYLQLTRADDSSAFLPSQSLPFAFVFVFVFVFVIVFVFVFVFVSLIQSGR